jgi:hypothetical protein
MKWPLRSDVKLSVRVAPFVEEGDDPGEAIARELDPTTASNMRHGHGVWRNVTPAHLTSYAITTFGT